MEAELDATLGYSKTKRTIWKATTKGMGILLKNSKANTGNSRLMYQGIATESLNLS